MQNKNTPTEGQNSTKLEAGSALRDAACCASWVQGAPTTEGGSYVVLWDNGAESVVWEWTGANATLAVGHIPIPPKPPLDYNPRAYRDCDDRGWVGKYSWYNAKRIHGGA